MVIPLGYGQANLKFQGTAAPFGAEVTFGFELLDEAMTPTGAAEVVGEAWADNVLAFQSSEITLASVLFKFGPNDLGGFGEFGINTAGGDSGTVMPPQVSALCRKLTADGGRANRGRMFIPGINEDRVEDGGMLNGTYATDFTAAVQAWATDCFDGDLRGVVLHGENSPVDFPSVITTLLIDSRCATQRKRNRR